jgi:hypothetical protein
MIFESAAVGEMHKRYRRRVRLQRIATGVLLGMMILIWTVFPEPSAVIVRELVAVSIWAVFSKVNARCPFCRGQFSWLWGTGHCLHCGF